MCIEFDRLNITWSLVPKKDRQAIDRYADIFSDKDNWSKFREHLDSLKLPCVPYIGNFATAKIKYKLIKFKD